MEGKVPLIYSLPQFLQYSLLLLPCNSEMSSCSRVSWVFQSPVPDGNPDRQNTAPTMETIAVLADKVLEQAALLQGHEGHVRWGW